MIGHLSFGVADLPRATRFYDAALGALGYDCVWTRDHGAVYGLTYYAAFVIGPEGYRLEAVHQ
jgi:catechol 2,3-dioxygenase-like lactoylglutathione lyase family enzyme